MKTIQKQILDHGSDLERTFDTQLAIHGQDINKPEPDVALIPGRRFKYDRVWRLEQLVVELEGGAQGRRVICHNCGEAVRAKRADGALGKEIRIGGWHQARERFMTDVDKYNLLTLIGFRLLRFTYQDVYSNPFEMVDLIRKALNLHIKSQHMIEDLSDKEMQVLHLMAAGMKTGQIAERLQLTENTIRTHSQNICEKLIVPNRTSAVARAAAWGLIDFSKIPFSDGVCFSFEEE